MGDELQRGERFGKLMAEYSPALARLAAAYEPQPAGREDLLQEIAAAVWTALPRSLLLFVGVFQHRWQVRRLEEDRDELLEAVRDAQPSGA